MSAMFNSEIIVIPSNVPHSIHWGSGSNFERFANSYFLEMASSVDKHVIASVKYEPDELYSRFDGIAGCCWIVTISEPFTQKYHIRNWVDIVHYYEHRGFTFVFLKKIEN